MQRIDDAEHSAVLTHQLQAAIEPGAVGFVLIDALLGEPSSDIPWNARASAANVQAAREAVWQRSVHAIAVPPKSKVLPAQAPYLIELQGPQDPWLAETVRLAQAARTAAMTDGFLGHGTAAQAIGGWLVTSQFGNALAQTLGDLIKLRTTALTQLSYLRLGDRRVLDLARTTLGDARLSAALGGINAWHYLDVHGRLATIQGTNQPPQPLRFDVDEWKRMAQGHDIHRVLAMALGEASNQPQPLPLSALDAARLYAGAGQGLQAARDAAVRWPARFVQERDRLFWAALSLVRPDAADHPAVRRLLESAVADGEPPQPLHAQAFTVLEILGLRVAQPA